MVGSENLVLHWPWRGLGGVREAGEAGGAWSRGCMTPPFAVAPHTVCMTTALLFLVITLRELSPKGPRVSHKYSSLDLDEEPRKGRRVQM